MKRRIRVKRKKSATMGCGGSKEDAVEGAGVAVKQTPESPKKEPALTQTQMQEKEADISRWVNVHFCMSICLSESDRHGGGLFCRPMTYLA